MSTTPLVGINHLTLLQVSPPDLVIIGRRAGASAARQGASLAK